MSDYITEANQAAEQYLTALSKVQDDLVNAVAIFVKQLPQAPAGVTVPALPTVDLPSPTEVTAVSFDFADKLLTQQRTYTDKLIGAITPAVTV